MSDSPASASPSAEASGSDRPRGFIRRHLTAIVIAALIFMAWLGMFLGGMFPFGRYGWELIIAPFGIIYAILLAEAALFLAAFIAPVRRSLRLSHSVWPRLRKALFTALATLILFFVLPPDRAGRRLGGYMGIMMQPVRDLQNSPAITRLAAAGQPFELPEQDWPPSLKEWKEHVWRIEVTPEPGHAPRIRILTGHRGSRFDFVLINHPLRPEDTADVIHHRWADGVWLGQNPGK